MEKIIKQQKVSKIVIKKKINHTDYKNTLFNSTQMYHRMKTIRSDHHNRSYELNKVSLSCFEDKRYLHDDGINSYSIKSAVTSAEVFGSSIKSFSNFGKSLVMFKFL